MTLLTSLARTVAASAGRAQRIRTVRHVHLSDRPLVLVTLAMAGEACAPLAALVGHDRDKPWLLTVHEPRNRTQRFEFAAGLADIVLRYIDGYIDGYADGSIDSCGDGRSDRGDDSHRDSQRDGRPATQADPGQSADPGQRPAEPLPDAPQLLVPNPQTAGFLRLLGRSTRFRRTEGEYAVPGAVPLLGRWLTHYAERTEVTPSALLLPLTAVLAEHWVTGQSAAEDANLGALIGWIDPPPGLTGAAAARAAEDPARCPPAGPATDPAFDDEVLEPLVKAVAAAAEAGDEMALTRARVALDSALRSQLNPTWELMWRGIDLLRALPEGAHVERRWRDDRKSFTDHAWWLRQGGAPQPRRDGAVAAARRLARLEREQQRLAVERAYDDPMVMAEYRLSGDAFAGTVVAADPARLDTSGKKAVLRPVVTVATADTVLVAPGQELASPARPSQAATVIEVLPAPAAGTAGTGAGPAGPAQEYPTLVTLKLKGGMGRSLTPAPGSIPEIGDEVTYSTLRKEPQRPLEFPAKEDTPWTHGGPPREYEPTDDDAREDWS